jgi:hypothetical protein
VQNAPRELVVESELSSEDVTSAVTQALATPGGLLTLVDDKGRQVLVPGDKIAYIEIGEPESRRVGFGSM